MATASSTTGEVQEGGEDRSSNDNVMVSTENTNVQREIGDPNGEELGGIRAFQEAGETKSNGKPSRRTELSRAYYDGIDGQEYNAWGGQRKWRKRRRRRRE